MLAIAELMFASTVPASTAPALGSIIFSHTSGSCGSSVDATVSPSWVVTNPDDTNYEVHVQENGVLVATQLSSSTSYSKTVAGFVESGSFRQFTSSWAYTVEVVRKSDGVVIASRSRTWTQLYGACTP